MNEVIPDNGTKEDDFFLIGSHVTSYAKNNRLKLSCSNKLDLVFVVLFTSLYLLLSRLFRIILFLLIIIKQFYVISSV